MPLDGDALPRPKAAQLSRGERRYRRKVASPKQWQAIIAEKIGPCRVCGAPEMDGGRFPIVQFHHVVARDHGGDDVASNIVPLCLACHGYIQNRAYVQAFSLLASLTDAEYSYMIARGGEDYPQRGYGVEYRR